MLEAQGLQDSLLLNNYDAAITRLVVLFWRFHDLAGWGALCVGQGTTSRR